MTEPTLGVIFRPQSAPERLKDAVQAADEAGISEFWVWEDCFSEGGLTAAAAALAWTTQIKVGIGLLPVPFRNPALAAMEIATLARIFPDRLLPGLGHGVQSWMAQVGAKVESPLTLLREHTDAIRALLHGQTVDTEGRYVKLSDVTLDWPPEQTPPVLLGAKGPKTIRLAGEVSDGAILEGSSTLDDIRKARELLTEGRAAGHLPGQPSIVAFSPVEPDAPDLPGQLRSQAAALAEAGADSVIFFSAADDNPAPEPIIEALAK